ncbi:endonuclease III domain-containing protein [uncultured Methanospirillum sp.]|uniref:endonuclease III domain-containing protein n=1 Tax=uncultured Methanospirillum sp. TaxID=262503 RepID=UPI0029C874C2|nr:endonuclease III domain-containing protein [uncultured Methanospirillum sp.]
MGEAVRLVIDLLQRVNMESRAEEPEITGEDLLTYYNALLTSFGNRGWWPADGWFETIVGAILTQNVSWTGASQAVQALKDAGLLDPNQILTTSKEIIAPLIRSSRYYNQKAERLQVFARFFVVQYNSDRTLMDRHDTGTIRSLLLDLKGFGPETVDSILLYACEKPIFVVDAYTKRIGSRIGWFAADASYQQMQEFFTTRLKPDTALFNDFHAQIVYLGNVVCKTRPLCSSCPLMKIDDRLRCRYNAPDNPKTRKTGNIQSRNICRSSHGA